MIICFAMTADLDYQRKQDIDRSSKPVFKTNTEVQREEASRSFGGANELLLVCFADVVSCQIKL